MREIYVCLKCNRNMERECYAHLTLDTHEWCQGKLTLYFNSQDLIHWLDKNFWREDGIGNYVVDVDDLKNLFNKGKENDF